MAEILLKALKPTLLEYIAKGRAAAPAAIAKLIALLSEWLPATIEKASVGLKGVAAKELPGLGAWMTAASGTVADWLTGYTNKL